MQPAALILCHQPVAGTVFRRWLPAVTGALLVLAAIGHTSVQAQTVYRIVGADGRVTFSDKPPVTASQVRPLDSMAPTAEASGAALPYELRQVVGKYPITLYTSKDCVPCDSGRNLLRGRGVPFTEKTITTPEDSDAFQRLSGSSSLPLLTLGSQQIKGYSDGEWAQYLSAAGYPAKSALPANYRNPAPAPMVVISKPAVPASTANAPAATPRPLAAPAPRINPNNPAGIQF